MRIQRADAVRAKLSELGITSADVDHAVAWAGREAAAAQWWWGEDPVPLAPIR